jgi:4-amino-4-deoxy-L-arabinose transferase-like glycosyltransferase
MSKQTIVLAAILILGLGLRLIHVGTLPQVLNRDEAALAYNALLLKETGKDEWGRVWPLALESFGDYKLPGYPLAVVAAFSVMGYSDLAVRIPSVLAGSLLILVGYWWARALKVSELGSLLVSFKMAVLPIFWFYSRMAFEANLALLFLTLAIGLVWFPVRRVPQWLADVGAVALALLAVFTYNTPLLLLPFIVVIIPLIRGLKQVRSWWLPVAGLVLVGVVAARILLPLSAQKSGITIFSDESTRVKAMEYRQSFSGLTQKILGNQVVYFGQLIARNTLASFSPSFLVTHGGTHPWHQLPMWGHLYWTVYALGLLGVALSLKHLIHPGLKHRPLNLVAQWVKKRTQTGWFNPSFLMIYLVLVSLIPSVITVDAPHATRSLLYFFGFVLIGASVVGRIRQLMGSKKTLFIITTLITIEALRYGWLYFKEYPQRQGAFQPGLTEVLREVESKTPNQPVTIVDGGGYTYISVAWYRKLSPEHFFATVVKQQPDRIGFKYGEKLDHYHFITRAADRKPEEKILVEWNEETLLWTYRIIN